MSQSYDYSRMYRLTRQQMIQVYARRKVLETITAANAQILADRERALCREMACINHLWIRTRPETLDWARDLVCELLYQSRAMQPPPPPNPWIFLDLDDSIPF